MTRTALFAATFFAASAAAAAAAPIASACMASDRPQANPQLCGCIQQVADMTLSPADQRRAAKFFRDPDAAQETRTSDSRNNEEFWARYRNFGSTAEAHCS